MSFEKNACISDDEDEGPPAKKKKIDQRRSLNAEPKERLSSQRKAYCISPKVQSHKNDFKQFRRSSDIENQWPLDRRQPGSHLSGGLPKNATDIERQKTNTMDGRNQPKKEFQPWEKRFDKNFHIPKKQDNPSKRATLQNKSIYDEIEENMTLLHEDKSSSLDRNNLDMTTTPVKATKDQSAELVVTPEQIIVCSPSKSQRRSSINRPANKRNPEKKPKKQQSSGQSSHSQVNRVQHNKNKFKWSQSPDRGQPEPRGHISRRENFQRERSSTSSFSPPMTRSRSRSLSRSSGGRQSPIRTRSTSRSRSVDPDSSDQSSQRSTSRTDRSRNNKRQSPSPKRARSRSRSVSPENKERYRSKSKSRSKAIEKNKLVKESNRKESSSRRERERSSTSNLSPYMTRSRSRSLSRASEGRQSPIRTRSVSRSRSVNRDLSESSQRSASKTDHSRSNRSRSRTKEKNKLEKESGSKKRSESRSHRSSSKSRPATENKRDKPTPDRDENYIMTRNRSRSRSMEPNKFYRDEPKSQNQDFSNRLRPRSKSREPERCCSTCDNEEKSLSSKSRRSSEEKLSAIPEKAKARHSDHKNRSHSVNSKEKNSSSSARASSSSRGPVSEPKKKKEEEIKNDRSERRKSTKEERRESQRQEELSEKEKEREKQKKIKELKDVNRKLELIHLQKKKQKITEELKNMDKEERERKREKELKHEKRKERKVSDSKEQDQKREREEKKEKRTDSHRNREKEVKKRRHDKRKEETVEETIIEKQSIQKEAEKSGLLETNTANIIETLEDGVDSSDYVHKKLRRRFSDTSNQEKELSNEDNNNNMSEVSAENPEEILENLDKNSKIDFPKIYNPFFPLKVRRSFSVDCKSDLSLDSELQKVKRSCSADFKSDPMLYSKFKYDSMNFVNDKSSPEKVPEKPLPPLPEIILSDNYENISDDDTSTVIFSPGEATRLKDLCDEKSTSLEKKETGRKRNNFRLKNLTNIKKQKMLLKKRKMNKLKLKRLREKQKRRKYRLTRIRDRRAAANKRIKSASSNCDKTEEPAVQNEIPSHFEKTTSRKDLSPKYRDSLEKISSRINLLSSQLSTIKKCENELEKGAEGLENSYKTVLDNARKTFKELISEHCITILEHFDIMSSEAVFADVVHDISEKCIIAIEEVSTVISHCMNSERSHDTEPNNSFPKDETKQPENISKNKQSQIKTSNQLESDLDNVAPNLYAGCPSGRPQENVALEEVLDAVRCQEYYQTQGSNQGVHITSQKSFNETSHSPLNNTSNNIPTSEQVPNASQRRTASINVPDASFTKQSGTPQRTRVFLHIHPYMIPTVPLSTTIAFPNVTSTYASSLQFTSPQYATTPTVHPEPIISPPQAASAPIPNVQTASPNIFCPVAPVLQNPSSESIPRPLVYGTYPSYFPAAQNQYYSSGCQYTSQTSAFGDRQSAAQRNSTSTQYIVPPSVCQPQSNITSPSVAQLSSSMSRFLSNGQTGSPLRQVRPRQPKKPAGKPVKQSKIIAETKTTDRSSNKFFKHDRVNPPQDFAPKVQEANPNTGKPIIESETQVPFKEDIAKKACSAEQGKQRVEEQIQPSIEKEKQVSVSDESTKETEQRLVEEEIEKSQEPVQPDEELEQQTPVIEERTTEAEKSLVEQEKEKSPEPVQSNVELEQQISAIEDRTKEAEKEKQTSIEPNVELENQVPATEETAKKASAEQQKQTKEQQVQVDLQQSDADRRKKEAQKKTEQTAGRKKPRVKVERQSPEEEERIIEAGEVIKKEIIDEENIPSTSATNIRIKKEKKIRGRNIGTFECIDLIDDSDDEIEVLDQELDQNIRMVKKDLDEEDNEQDQDQSESEGEEEAASEEQPPSLPPLEEIDEYTKMRECAEESCSSYARFRCTNCRCVIYCSLGCQRLHWEQQHSLNCTKYKEIRVFLKKDSSKTTD